jgi:hypothetical protein
MQSNKVSKFILFTGLLVLPKRYNRNQSLALVIYGKNAQVGSESSHLGMPTQVKLFFVSGIKSLKMVTRVRDNHLTRYNTA